MLGLLTSFSLSNDSNGSYYWGVAATVKTAVYSPAAIYIHFENNQSEGEID